jgi:hypothetical protein
LLGRRLPFLLALFGVVVCSLPGPGRASIILAIQPLSGSDIGVMACVDQQCDFAPATENPAHAEFGTVVSALAQGGSFIRFAFSLNGTIGQNQYASTAYTSTYASSIPITIVGTAGEPVGTPVSLRLTSGTDVDPSYAEEITNELNDPNYASNTDVFLDGFKVGDTFFYWASVSVIGNNPLTFQVQLSVQEIGSSAIAEPGTLALLTTACLALGFYRRRHRRGNRRVPRPSHDRGAEA